MIIVFLIFQEHKYLNKIIIKQSYYDGKDIVSYVISTVV